MTNISYFHRQMQDIKDDILAMAGLLYEMRKENERFSPVRIEVLPGITAASISASALGAPLQNGFCLLSLSDLLVPAEEIRANLEQSAGTALPVVLYNPAGRKRRFYVRGPGRGGTPPESALRAEYLGVRRRAARPPDDGA